MRIATTALDAFRRWRDPEQDWFTEEQLIAQIRGELPPSPEATLGTAYGQIIENPQKFAVAPNPWTGAPQGYQHFLIDKQGQRLNTHYFDADTVAPALALFDYERGLFEVKAVKRYRDDIDVVAKCDYICGAVIDENKTTQDAPDFDRYYQSYQWRFMLDIFEADVCRYNVFQLSVSKEGIISLRDIYRFSLYRYPELEQDCRTLLDEFVEWATFRGLDTYLRERQAKAEVA